MEKNLKKYIYIRLKHFVVHQKLIQHYKPSLAKNLAPSGMVFIH